MGEGRHPLAEVRQDRFQSEKIRRTIGASMTLRRRCWNIST